MNTVALSAQEFDMLWTTTMAWEELDGWKDQDWRFDTVDGSPVDYTLAHAYWFGNSPASVILAGKFLTEQGVRSQTVWDSVLTEWVLLTDYACGPEAVK